MADRKPLKQSTRNEVLARQQNNCERCRELLDMRAVHFDHIKPRSEGGTDEPDNLQALCPNCHAKKTNEDRKRGSFNNKKRNEEETHEDDNKLKQLGLVIDDTYAPDELK
jgi:5-methylcytosine-specific restriction enzyme A